MYNRFCWLSWKLYELFFFVFGFWLLYYICKCYYYKLIVLFCINSNFQKLRVPKKLSCTNTVSTVYRMTRQQNKCILFQTFPNLSQLARRVQLIIVWLACCAVLPQALINLIISYENNAKSFVCTHHYQESNTKMY